MIAASGQVIRSGPSVDAFLANIARFYHQAQVKKNPCRFDYTLTYKSDRDYHIGRDLFERYFYPAGIRPLQGAAQ